MRKSYLTKYAINAIIWQFLNLARKLLYCKCKLRTRTTCPMSHNVGYTNENTKRTKMNSRTNKTYVLCIRVKTLPSHGKTCLELYASNYAANIWTERPDYAVSMTKTMAHEMCDRFCRVRRVDCTVKTFPPTPDSDAINEF